MTPINDLLTAAAAKLGKKPEDVWPLWFTPYANQYTGPDLTQSEHLNDALEVADALCAKGEKCDVDWLRDEGRYSCAIWRENDLPFATAPTRIAAVRAAIEEACK